MDISVIVPCYNESENIPKIKRELLPVLEMLAAKNVTELVFVDDGSCDSTLHALIALQEENRAVQFSIKVEAHPRNRGLGAAMRTGFSAASGKIIVTTDCDGTYAFTTIPTLLSSLTGSIDIVTASPYHPLGKVVGVSGYRLALSKGSSLIYRLLVDRRIHTYTSLFRAYRREVIEDIQFGANGFLAGTELMVKGILSGYRVAEFPATLSRRVCGVSKAKIWRTILAHLQFQARILLHQMRLVSLFGRDKQKRGHRWQSNKAPSVGDSN